MSYWSMICAGPKDPFFPLPLEIYPKCCKIKRKSIKLRQRITMRITTMTITITTTTIGSRNNIPNMERASRHRRPDHPLPPTPDCIWRQPTMPGRFVSWNRPRRRVKSYITIPTELLLFHVVPFGPMEDPYRRRIRRNEPPWNWQVVERIVQFISGTSSNQSTCVVISWFRRLFVFNQNLSTDFLLAFFLGMVDIAAK
jgi:hypothetical protein